MSGFASRAPRQLVLLAAMVWSCSGADPPAAERAGSCEQLVEASRAEAEGFLTELSGLAASDPAVPAIAERIGGGGMGVDKRAEELTCSAEQLGELACLAYADLEARGEAAEAYLRSSVEACDRGRFSGTGG
jgi:hypothetical protein